MPKPTKAQIEQLWRNESKAAKTVEQLWDAVNAYLYREALADELLKQQEARGNASAMQNA
jgi:hypothetical protein